MQYPQTHVISGTDQASLLEVHNDNRKNADNPRERVLATTIKHTKSNDAIGHGVQFGCRHAQGLAQLGPVIDAAIKQHDKSIGEKEGLMLQEIFGRELMQTEYESRIASHQDFLPVRPIRFEHVR